MAVAITLVLAPTAPAQLAPSVSSVAQSMDSVRQDVARMDSAARPPGRIQCADCGMLLLPAAAVLLAAPSVFAWPDTSIDARIYDLSVTPRFWRNHVAVYLTGGPAFPDSTDYGWSHSENVEAQWRGVYAEARLESFSLPRKVRYRTARLGYFLHPRSSLAGGVTIGYRQSRGLPSHSGPEIALPLLIGGSKGWGRFEPQYVYSRAGVHWNYRLQAEVPLPNHPAFVAGGTIEAKALPLRRGSHVGWMTGALLIGVRL